MEGQNKDDDEDPVQHTELKELPYDIIREMILPRLPMKSIVRFKSVSKFWYSTLSYSRFSFAQLKFYQSPTTESLLIRNDNKFKILSYQNGEIDLVKVKVDFDVDDEEMVLVGTCNGLVCLGSTSGRLFIVWNPITCQLRKYLTKISHSFVPKCLVYYWGFGCVSNGDDYKIVRLNIDMSNHSLTVHVYSIKLDTWTLIDDNTAFDDTSQLDLSSHSLSGLFVNETLYWRLPGTICSFNLATEKLDTFRHLEVIGIPLSYVTTSDNLLFVVNGCLSSYGTCLTNDDDRIFSILRSLDVTEQIIVPKDVTESIHYGGNLIGFTRSDKIFTQYSDSLGVIDLSQHPLKITPLMNLVILSHHQTSFVGRKRHIDHRTYSAIKVRKFLANLKKEGITEIVSYRASLISPKFPCYKFVQG